MVRAKAPGEMTVLKGVIEMIVRVIGAGVMADPILTSIDMRRIRMACMIAEVGMILSRPGCSMKGRRSVGWRRAGVSTGMLCKGRYACNQNCC